MPDYCQTGKYLEIIKDSRTRYKDTENNRIHMATARVLKEGNFLWPKVREVIEFAKILGVKKVGLAVCIGLIREGREFARFAERAGLEVVSVACMVGGLEPKETGIPDEYLYGRMLACNPVAQAEIMNHKETELNYIYGLCTGHDTLFIKYSKAPVTYVVVKDMVTGNNPSGALYSAIHRERLWNELAGKR
jgi:uncharacterized metal-binding protein